MSSLRSNPHPADLGRYQWENRLLLAFAPSQQDPAYQRQESLLEGQAAELNDRDLVVFRILAEGTSTVGEDEITPESAEALRQRFDVLSDQFAVVLIGKDGTVKIKRQEPLLPKDLYGIIDAMPMRRAEIARRRSDDQGS